MDWAEKLDDLLQKYIPQMKVIAEEPMSRHTTFRIGGAADYFVSPQTTDQIKNIIDLCKSEAMPWYVIGNGSNLLVSDRGFRGVIIQLFKNFSDLRVEGDRLYVQAGTLLSRTAKKALEASLTGFEFAAGIPGTIGGAMVMNAGAYGGEMKDVLYKCEHIDKNGDIGFLENDDLKLSYRHSAYYDNGAVITGLYLKLKKGEKVECPVCHNGYYVPVNTTADKAHYFVCTNKECNGHYRWEPIIDIE